MRWLFRPVTTLLLGPLLFAIVALYFRATTSANDIVWPDVARQLQKIYVDYTLPGLVLVLVVLLPFDLILRRTGFGLVTVFVSPVLAVAAVSLLRDVVTEPHVQAWSSLWLAAAYGLVWGLTIRDPRQVMSV